MKKLIGLLGAAGLLIPSAAMAGSIGDQYGSEALRTSGVSESVQNVKVFSNMTVNNDVDIEGSNRGSDLSISAEDFNDGRREYHYGRYDVTAQQAADVDLDVRADGHYDVNSKNKHENDYRNTRKVFEGQAYEPATTESHCIRGHWGCHHETTHATPEEPRKVVRFGFDDNTHTGSADGVFGGGILGSYDAIATVDSQGELERGSGSGSFIDGSYNRSKNSYKGEYKGTLKEHGTTKTTVTSKTTSAATFNGFESGSFNTTSWN